MEEIIHLDDRGDGNATIFCGTGTWKRQPGEGPHPGAAWLDMSTDELVTPDGKTWRFLERAYRHQETTEPVKRHPRVYRPLAVGQPVYCPTYGFGEVVAIDSDDITAMFGKKKRLVEKHELVTRVQAEVHWHEYWLTGEKRRLREGKKLFIVKGLCRHGEWQVFLDRYGIPRSTADDLIQRYLDSILQSGDTRHLPGNRANGLGDPASDLNDQPTDPDELAELVEQEAEKRRGKTPTQNLEYWNVRIKLPPAVVTRCRERYKEPDAKEYWIGAAYAFVEEDSSSEE